MPHRHQIKKNINSILIGLTIGFFSHSAQATVLDSRLARMVEESGPHLEISVIVRFAEETVYRQFTASEGDGQLGNRFQTRRKAEADAPGLFSQMNRQQRRKKLIRSLKEKTDISRMRIGERLTGYGLKTSRLLWAINAVALKADAGLIDELSKHPAVKDIRPDLTIRMPMPLPAQSSNSNWNLDKIGAPDMWALGYTGQGVVLAIMDTGVDADHPDLIRRWRGGDNSWCDPYGVYSVPHDPSGHGTQVAGILVGGASSGMAIGVAPGARWIAVKIYDDAGDASYSAIHLGFQWLLDPDGDPDTDDAPDAVNNSWGLTDAVDSCVAEFEEDVRILTEAGIALVFAAGNVGPIGSTSISPGNYKDCIAVGALDDNDQVADFSSRGPSACGNAPYPTLAAPGEFLRTADLTLGGVNDPYATVAGTSYAAGHVTGAMALLLSAEPGAGLDDLKTAIIQSCADRGPAGPDNDSGHGLINVPDAFLLLQKQMGKASGDGGCFISSMKPAGRSYGCY